MKVLKALAWIAGILCAIGFLLNVTVIETWTVPVDDAAMSASIEPTLRAGDVIVLTRSKGTARSDLLRCPDPQAPGRFVIARAKALGGEEIAIGDGRITVDGRLNSSRRNCDPVTVEDPVSHAQVELHCTVEESGDSTYEVLLPTQKGQTVARVEKGRAFLVSDNRQMPVDSRDYGAVDPALCQKVIFRLWGESGFSDRTRRFTFLW
jgi:signal peptidase I